MSVGVMLEAGPLLSVTLRLQCDISGLIKRRGGTQLRTRSAL
jgi:hypothetical protein